MKTPTLLVFVAATTLGCAQFVRTQGPWVEPVDLRLNHQSLESRSFYVDCEFSGSFCTSIKKNLTSLGAFLTKEAAESEIQILFQERDISNDYCGVWLTATILTFGLMPCRNVKQMDYLLTFKETVSGIESSYPVQLELHEIFGLYGVALYFAPNALRSRRRKVGSRFIQFVQNQSVNAAHRIDLRQTRLGDL